MKSFIYVKLSKNTKWWMDEGWGNYVYVVIFFNLLPEIIQIIPKHILIIIMIILPQEQLLYKIPQLPSLLCKLRAGILDFILISWLFFKTGGRNEFLPPKYPRIEVLFMIAAPEDQFLH